MNALGKMGTLNLHPPPMSLAPRQQISPLTAGLIGVALVAGVFALYSPALNFQFILDDHRFLSDPRVQSSGHVWEYFTRYVWAQVAGGPVTFYRPAFVLWIRLNYMLCEMSPWGWHLLSVAKHLLVAVLLAWLVWKLLRDRVAALVAATLFSIHPSQTESVAWVTVPDPLLSAAMLMALILYISYVNGTRPGNFLVAGKTPKKLNKRTRAQPGPNSPAILIASAILSFVALLAKETGMLFPFVLFAAAWMNPLAPNSAKSSVGDASPLKGRLLSAFRNTLPYLCVTAIYVGMRLYALKGQFSPHTQHLPLRTVLLSIPAILWFYTKVLFWPVRSHAFADPILVDTFSLHAVLLPGLGVCCAGLLLACACLWAWTTARRHLPPQQALGVSRALLLGSLLLVLPILLALNLNVLNPGDFLHGRYTYLPLAGFMLLFAAVCHMMKNRGIWLVAAGVVAVVFVILTSQQMQMWKDDLTVFTVAHQIAPHNEPVAHNLVSAQVQVALGLDESDRCNEAMPIFEQAIQQYPQDWFAWAGRGECFFKLNNLPAAEESLHRASELAHEPRVTEAWQQLRARMGLNSALSQ